MSSWRLLACYPRRTFYPLSDGPSMQDHRITMPEFPPCLRCLSRSQAPLCLCTLRLISKQPEGTLGRLRYALGGDRPSQTTHQAMSSTPIQGSKLELQNNQGGISRLAPPHLAAWLQSLPPILHRLSQSPLPSYSKGSRGLSVLTRVSGVFTALTTSLSPSLRQC